MKYSYQVCGLKWTEEFRERVVKEYKYIKQVYIEVDTEDDKENKLLEQVKEIIENEKYQNDEELKKDLELNKIFKLNNNVDFVIRRIIFNVENKKNVYIKNCVIQFLFKQDDELLELLNNFTNKAKVGKIEMKFEEYKWHDEVRYNCVETVKQLLDLGMKENYLEEFFKEKTVVYSKEIKLDEINCLRKVPDGINNIKGIILLFISPQDITLGTVTTAIEDVQFFLGARDNTDLLYDIKFEKESKETKISTIIAV